MKKMNVQTRLTLLILLVFGFFISFVTKATPLAGSYTVDKSGSGDYKTITAAVNDLVSKGISSSVIFTIKGGVYNEHISLPEIAGANKNTTITFDGVHYDSVTISSTSTSTLLLDGADYIIIKNVSVINLNTTQQNVFAIALINDANHNIIEHCKAKDSTWAYGSAAILLAKTENAYTYGNNDSNTIKKCVVEGGNGGIMIFGNTSNSKDTSSFNIVTGCIINSYQYGVYVMYNNNYLIHDNVINVTSSYPYSLQLSYSGDGQVYNNVLKSKYVGIGLTHENFVFGKHTKIYNNFIYGDIRLYNTNDIGFYHNSQKSKRNGLYLDKANRLYVKNNIFDIKSCSNYAINSPGGILNTEFERNIFFDSANTFSIKNGIYIDIKKALTALGINASKQWYQNPNFVSDSNIHLNFTYAPEYGVSGLGIEKDIDGDNRCKYGPTVGADESKYPMTKAKASFSVNDTVCLNSITTFVNSADETDPFNYHWHVNGNFESTNHHLSYSFISKNRDTIKLVTYGCNGIDSMEKIVNADYQWAKVKPEFIASKNILEPFEVVQLNDLTQYCPNKWKWTITPPPYSVNSYFVNGTSDTVQNPQVRFDIPGFYKVCLEADNGLGALKKCKGYVFAVKNVYILGDTTNFHSQYLRDGILYDDGGGDSNYGLNKEYTFMLDPCAKQISLKFLEFDVAMGATLKIYNDSNGKALWDTIKYPSGLTNIRTILQLGKDTLITSKTGKMYVVWKNWNLSATRGFKAEWSSIPKTYTKPTTTILAPDTVCVNEWVTFEAVTTGKELFYEWSFIDTVTIDSRIKSPSYKFAKPGIYGVVNRVYSKCNHYTDSFVKKVVVVSPTAAPKVNFKADNVQPVASESKVRFYNESYRCTDSVEWFIIPQNSGMNYQYMNGDNKAENPVIRFMNKGCLDVKLLAYYNGNVDSLTKVCYINAIEYCKPSVTNTNVDVGISRVKLGKIDNISSVGVDRYTNYTSQKSTKLELQAKYVLRISRKTALNAATRKVWIDWNIDGDFDDANEEIFYERNVKTKEFVDTFIVPSTAKVGKTRMRVAIALGNVNIKSCGNISYGEVEDYEVIISTDSTPPVIVLFGYETVYVNQCNSYTDLGATAMDNINGDVSSFIITSTNLNTSYPDTYCYWYELPPTFGGVAKAKRIIIVTPDTIGPTITLLGNKAYWGDFIDSVEVNKSWTDAGYTVNQRCVPVVRITYDTSQLDISKVGEYEIVYEAEDSLGNITTQIRYVRVVDTTAPTAILNGKAIDTVNIYSSWTDPGVTIKDNYYHNLSPKIIGSVNTNIIGVYELTYKVTDPSGNGPVVLNRTVYVLDVEPPKVESYVYSHNDTITVDVYSSFKIPKLDISDNYSSKLTEWESGSVLQVLSNGKIISVGLYDYRYKVTDSSGNVGEFVLYINSVDREAPIITLHGSPYTILYRFEILSTSDSASVTDNYDENVKIVEGGSYVTDYLVKMLTGTYTLTYDATDISGNKAKTVYRTIQVINDPYSIRDNLLFKKIKLYPNPSKGMFNIEFDFSVSSDVEVVVLNALGQIVFSRSISNISNEIIDFDLNLSNGLYNIKVISKDEQAVLPLIITR